MTDDESVGIFELSDEEIRMVRGGDNPGMGSYDGKGDTSCYVPFAKYCGWNDNGRAMCIF